MTDKFQLPDTTFYDYPIYSLGDGKIEDMEYGECLFFRNEPR